MRSLSSVGAWLVVIGAVTGVAPLVFGGENPPAALYLVFVLFGVGWIVIGYDASRQAAG